MAVVEPCLDVPGRIMCSNLHVEICGPVQVGDRHDAMHDSFERSEPVVKLIVETLGAQPVRFVRKRQQHVGPSANPPTLISWAQTLRCGPAAQYDPWELPCRV